jgi:Arc/MetJ family transcription regulator
MKRNAITSKLRIEIDDDVLREVMLYRPNKTLREVIEEALRLLIRSGYSETHKRSRGEGGLRRKSR